MATKRNIPSTQRYLHISEVRDNVIVMDDGTLRSILMVSSINFALKNEDEQNAIIGAYVSFLNNLSFPLQIVVQSRELNITNYLEDLKKREKEQTNELLKVQTRDYVEYISELVSLGKIMNKRFFVIVPYNPISDSRKGFMAMIKELFSPVDTIRMKESKFIRLQKELSRRVDSVISGLTSVGLNTVELDTQGLIELLYDSYNPDTSPNQKMDNINNLRVK